MKLWRLLTDCATRFIILNKLHYSLYVERLLNDKGKDLQFFNTK